jgi:multicomponent Na+:H+ antiporter subunit D
MTNNWIILFVVIPLACGVLSIPLVRWVYLQRMLGVFSLWSTMLLAIGWLTTMPTGTIFVSQMGQWPAPYGISIIFDSLSGLLLAASSLVALGCYIHSFSMLDPNVERRYFHPLIQLLMFGVNMSFLTGDLFNLFVAFEVMLMASYALISIGASRAQLTQVYKYILLNLIASTIFVISAGMVYGMMGTLNFADLARKVAITVADPNASLPTGFTALSVMILLVFGVKGAFFPLWFWLPDTYYTCPISIGGLFAGMLTKVGVYSVARTFPLIFAQPGSPNLQVIVPILAISAAFTMFLGVLGAVSQHRVRRILSVHVISQVGYMIFGITLMSVAGLAGCVFYMIQHMVVKSALFLCCGVMEKHAGSDDLDKIGGILKRDRWLGVLFFIAAMSLVGLPPLSGFFGKLVIIRDGWNHFWWLSIVGLLTGGLTLLSMLKIWSYGFWYPPAGDHADLPADAPRPKMRSAYAGIILLVVSALGLGLGAQPVYNIADKAGEQLQVEAKIDPTTGVVRIKNDYIKAVLGPQALIHFTASAQTHKTEKIPVAGLKPANGSAQALEVKSAHLPEEVSVAEAEQ